jgi:hypothetical protein
LFKIAPGNFVLRFSRPPDGSGVTARPCAARPHPDIPVGVTLAAVNAAAIFRPESVTTFNLLPELIRKILLVSFEKTD